MRGLVTNLLPLGVYLVILSGRLIGVHHNPQAFATSFRALRRAGKVPPFVSIYENESHRAVYIASDGGRVCRPLIIVERGAPLVRPHHLKVCPLSSLCSPFCSLLYAPFSLFSAPFGLLSANYSLTLGPPHPSRSWWLACAPSTTSSRTV
jgi:hypothetical protein